MPRVMIAALYHFVALDDYVDLRPRILERAEQAGVLGTLLLAHEGINGTIAGEEASLRAFLEFLQQDPRLANLTYKVSWASEMPFIRLKVRLKKEIVTIGLPEVDPTRVVGTYVKPTEWNALISDPDVVLIDTRNDYEVDIGTFQGAIDPRTKSFTEFPEWTKTAPELQGKKRVAMFCTGGIRCEKASSYMLEQGFEEVYHLEGGILKYLEEVPREQSMWQGDCFVFDRRVSVDHDLQPGDYTMCAGCRRPVSPDERASEKYIEGVSCPVCHDTLTDDQRARFAQRHLQMKLARERGETFWGRKPERTPTRSQPVLYSFRRCPYAMRARMALRAAGITVELREVVLRDKPSHMLELSPKGTVPVLWLESGEVIDESLDVMRWALTRQDPEAWWPTDLDAQSQALALVARNDDEFKFHLDRYKYPNRYEGAVAEEHRDAATAFLQTLEEALTGQPFLHGHTMGFVDAAILPFVRQFANTDRGWFDQTPFPQLHRWLAHGLAAESFTGVMDKYAKWEEGAAVVLFPAASA